MEQHYGTPSRGRRAPLDEPVEKPRSGRCPTGTLVVLIKAALVLVGCSSAEAQREPWHLDEPFNELVDEFVDQAEAGGASEEQIAILQAAGEAGELPLEAAKTAARAVVACFQESGLEAEYLESTDPTGFTAPDYQVTYDESVPEETTDQLVATCEDREFTWVNQAYHFQPERRQALGEYVMGKEEVLRACIEQAGYTTDPDDDGWALAQQSTTILSETQGAVNCLDAADISSL